MEKFISEKGIKRSDHVLRSKGKEGAKEGVTLRYTRLGSGPKMLHLANGVGTDFFMWRPFLQWVLTFDPDFFSKFTLIAQSYRGLFHPDDAEFSAGCEITIDNCVEDVREVMTHAGIAKYDTVLGWSTGAQVALALGAKYPTLISRLFLFNPSVGHTLHTVLQPLKPMPAVVGRFVSAVIHTGFGFLKTLIPSKVWDILKIVAYSTGFRWFLEVLAFTGGFPPEQPVYFHQYMKDVFFTRMQTRALLDLILSLDAPCPPHSTTLPHPTVVLSGYPDFITGVYHSYQLQREMKKCKHITFSMGSHFLLLEWPELASRYLVEFLNDA
ncbi:Alpha/Beta hydrolase protein [Ochromonadaceae sp. CCMP2298]|nr:Alpha/Beta hydrolase protein [Ochromonadaceae sp. CCMP2298]